MWLGNASELTLVNGTITCISKTIDAVAGEAEYAGVFMLAQEKESITNFFAGYGLLSRLTSNRHLL